MNIRCGKLVREGASEEGTGKGLGGLELGGWRKRRIPPRRTSGKGVLCAGQNVGKDGLGLGGLGA